MKKAIGFIALWVAAGTCFTSARAQVSGEKNVTIGLDLQPILKLDITSGDNLEFTFDKVSSYAGGIVRYGATVLRVSSSMNWDLYVVGTSNDPSGLYMDNQVTYGTSSDPYALSTVPLDILELHQVQKNSVAFPDYSAPFQPVIAGAVATRGQNNIDIANALTPYSSSTATKMLEGDNTSAGFGIGGSYLTAPAYVSGAVPYTFTVDYRIVPGLPTIFPTSVTAAALFGTSTASSTYVKPGLYTMDVKYVLSENQ